DRPRDGSVVGSIDLVDRLRVDARPTTAALRRDGLAVAILSGDAPGAVAEAAEALDVAPDSARGACLPADKVAAIGDLRRRWGGPVAFVGDGLNDAPALAAAD